MAKTKTSFTKATAPKNGRPKGAKNRTTEQMRTFIQHLIDDNLEQIVEDINKMNPVNRVNCLEKLIKYVLPALQKNDNNNEVSGGITIKVEYADADNKTE